MYENIPMCFNKSHDRLRQYGFSYSPVYACGFRIYLALQEHKMCLTCHD